MRDNFLKMLTRQAIAHVEHECDKAAASTMMARGRSDKASFRAAQFKIRSRSLQASSTTVKDVAVETGVPI